MGWPEDCWPWSSGCRAQGVRWDGIPSALSMWLTSGPCCEHSDLGFLSSPTAPVAPVLATSHHGWSCFLYRPFPPSLHAAAIAIPIKL